MVNNKCGFLLYSVLAIGQVAIPSIAVADDVVRIWLRAFIPKEHPTNQSYIQPVPGMPGRFMIPDPGDALLKKLFPEISTACFLTDHRGFVSTPGAPSRVTSDIILTVSGSKAEVKPAIAESFHYTGETHMVDCLTGKDLKPAKRAETNSCAVGTPSVADGLVQVYVSCKANNPLFSMSPTIDYGGSFTFNTQTKSIFYKGDISSFPAFEAYAALDSRSPVMIFTAPPEKGSSVWSLFDAGLFTNTRTFQSDTVNLSISSYTLHPPSNLRLSN